MSESSRSLIDSLEDAINEAITRKQGPRQAARDCIAIIRQRTAAPDVVEDLLQAASRVYKKYGIDSDWTEWQDLKDAIAAMQQTTPVSINSHGGTIQTLYTSSERNQKTSENEHIKDEALTTDNAFKTSNVGRSEISYNESKLRAFIAESIEDDLHDSFTERSQALIVADKVMASIRPYLRTTEPVSVSLHDCAVRVGDLDNTVFRNSHANCRTIAKYVLDAAKEQGAKFDYVD